MAAPRGNAGTQHGAFRSCTTDHATAQSSGQCDCRARRALRQPARHRAGGARTARPYDDLDRQPAAGRGVLSADDGGSAGGRAAVRVGARAGGRVRRRHLARRPGQRAARRRLPRFSRHEPRARRPRRGSRLRHRARHYPKAAQRISARQGRVLPDRSRRRRLARRHGGDALLPAPMRCATAP